MGYFWGQSCASARDRLSLALLALSSVVPLVCDRCFGSCDKKVGSSGQKASQGPSNDEAFDHVAHKHRCFDRDPHREEVEASPHKRSFAVVSIEVAGYTAEGQCPNKGKA